MRWDFWRAKPAVVPSAVAPQRKEPTLRFSESTLATLRTKSAKARKSPFVIPQPPPGVVSKANAKMAMDSDIQSVYQWASQSAYGEGLHFMGYAYLAELTQRAEYRRISEVIAKEMTRKWIKLQAMGDESKTEKVKALTAALEKFKVQEHFRRIAELDGDFGRAHLYIDTGKGDDPDELVTPLMVDPTKIGRGSLKRLATVEPLWTYPGQYTSSDPLASDFYNPQSWWVNGKEVHASRLLTFVGRKMPDLLKPAYLFGGLSMTQMAKPYVDFWLRDRESVSDLVNNFSMSGLKTNLGAVLSDPLGGGVENRMQGFATAKENRGILLLDKDSEDFFNVSVPLGTLDKLQAQAQEHMSSVSGIPLVKLTGITPAGLNASSDGEIRTWYDWVRALQESLFTENLKIVIDIIQLSEFGEIDKSITFDYVDLWELDAAGKATVRKTDADTAAVLIQEGVISPEEERERQATDPDSIYAGLDLTGEPPELPSGKEPDTNDPEANRVDEGAFSGSENGANSGV